MKKNIITIMNSCRYIDYSLGLIGNTRMSNEEKLSIINSPKGTSCINWEANIRNLDFNKVKDWYIKSALYGYYENSGRYSYIATRVKRRSTWVTLTYIFATLFAAMPILFAYVNKWVILVIFALFPGILWGIVKAKTQTRIEFAIEEATDRIVDEIERASGGCSTSGFGSVLAIILGIVFYFITSMFVVTFSTLIYESHLLGVYPLLCFIVHFIVTGVIFKEKNYHTRKQATKYAVITIITFVAIYLFYFIAGFDKVMAKLGEFAGFWGIKK